MSGANMELIPVSKHFIDKMDKSDIDIWTKYLLPHPTQFWKFWNLDDDFKCIYVNLATIYKEEGLIKPELLITCEQISYDEALAHLELLISPNSQFLQDEVIIRAISYLIYHWFTRESADSELKRLLGDCRG